MCMPIADGFFGRKRRIVPEPDFCDSRLTPGEGNYGGRRFEMQEEVAREWEEGGDGRRGRVCGVGVVLVEVACGVLYR